MGMSRIEINVTGNHGCNREAKEGERLGVLCDAPSCVDCRTREFVARLQAAGNVVEGPAITGPGGTFEHGATLTHWPHDAGGGIVDDLVAGVRRKGHF